MPHRLVSVAILLFWSVTAVGLITRDILPELLIGDPPDLRTIAGAEKDAGPARWAVQVADPTSSDPPRSVGQAVTESTRKPDGWVEMSSKVLFDAGGLLKGTPFDVKTKVRLEVSSTYVIDPSGNLRSFAARVRSLADPEELLILEGTLKGRTMEVVARGPLPILNWTRSFPYQPRAVVQNALGPLDRLPGLQVGQRWETKVVSPLTGRIETVRAEVARRAMIHWDKSPVKTFEVVHHLAGLSARTWVHPNGLVLRQEVPYPFVKLVLERLPNHANAPGHEGPGR